MGRKILVVDDDLDTCETLSLGLRRSDYDAAAVQTAAAALDWLSESSPSAVLCDIGLGRDDGMELCREIVARWPDVPVIVVTGQGDFDTAVSAMRAGAYDFIAKPVLLDALRMSLTRAIEHNELRSEVRRLRETQIEPHPSGIIGDSRSLRRVMDLVERIGEGGTSVLISGESGTGKELVARAIHDRSGRTGRFVALNCAAMPAALLESELFGHVRGAFTDAKANREGLFLQADGGTLFLDEMGEMPMEMQAKLLRVLQERRLRPVGGDREIAFDTRIIAATNRDLEEEVAAGRFREDLFYRINVIRVEVPPLRARGNDILLLAQHFLANVAAKQKKAVEGISPEAAAKLRDYNWPGNVRELENCMERAVTLTKTSLIVVDDLPSAMQKFQPRSLVIEGDDPTQLPSLAEMEERYIRRVLEATNWNKSKAARILRIERRTLYRKIERLELGAPE